MRGARRRPAAAVLRGCLTAAVLGIAVAGSLEDLEDGCPECEVPEDREAAATSLLQLSHAHQRSAAAERSADAGGGGGAGEGEGTALAPPSKNCVGFDCLQQYVAMPDPAYTWSDTSLRLRGHSDGVPWTGALLNMTSQRWLSALDTKTPEWSHGVVVIRPGTLEGAPSPAAGWATLYVCLGWYGSDGGPGLGELRAEDDDVQAAAALAVRTGAPAAIVYAVPPKVEVSVDHVARAEDDLLAHGQLRFLRSRGKQRWLVELPMTKAVVRAMDTVSNYTSSAWGYDIHSFALTGASKRGAATWHAAAVDGRVKAIAPMAKSLDTTAFVRRSVQSYGGVPVVGAPYMNRPLVMAGHDRLYSRMRSITDPVSYAERYAGVAKLVIDAAQDEYFMPDHASIWWRRLPGAKSHLVVTDGGHIVGGPAVRKLVEPIGAFIRSQQLGKAAPALDWSVDLAAGRIEAWLPSGEPPPLSVELWQAHTCDSRRRDFRLHNYDVGENCTRCGMQLATPAPLDAPAPTCRNLAVQWSGAPIAAAPESDGRRWIAQVAPPQDGRWLAFFLQFEFPGPAPPLASPGEALRSRWRLSTEVAVVPNTFPFPDADGTPAGMRSARLVLAEGGAA